MQPSGQLYNPDETKLFSKSAFSHSFIRRQEVFLKENPPLWLFKKLICGMGALERENLSGAGARSFLMYIGLRSRQHQLSLLAASSCASQDLDKV